MLFVFISVSACTYMYALVVVVAVWFTSTIKLKQNFSLCIIWSLKCRIVGKFSLCSENIKNCSFCLASSLFINLRKSHNNLPLLPNADIQVTIRYTMLNCSQSLRQAIRHTCWWIVSICLMPAIYVLRWSRGYIVAFAIRIYAIDGICIYVMEGCSIIFNAVCPIELILWLYEYTLCLSSGS